MVGMRNGRLTAAAVFVLLMSSYTAEGLSPHAGSNLQPGACRAAFACNGAAAHLMPAWRSATCEFSGRAAQAGHVLPRARGVRAGGAGVAQWAMQQQKAGWSRPGELGQTMSQMVKEKRRMDLGGLRQLPRVYPAEETINKAINQCMYVKEDLEVRNSRNRARKWAAERANELSKYLTKPLGETLDGYDKVLRRLQPFEKVVCDLTVKARELSGYGSLSQTLEKVRELRKNSMELCKAAAQAGKNAETRKMAEQEIDILIDAAEELWQRDGWAVDMLLDMGKELRNVPMLDTELDTVVLVGSPNVGKSSIVRAISTGTPEVNNYPFTTRGMTLGHVIDQEGDRVCQVMDTPGLLPRSDAKRNEMEMLTLASMQHLKSVVVFVLDLTSESGEKSTIDAQLAVRTELRIRFPDHPWIDAVSKADLDLPEDQLARAPEGAVQISSTTFLGIEELEARVTAGLQQLKERKEEAEMALRLRRID
eukprot:CAMPEP_0180309954 /NCGR_PEP_ID=MMETSP0988-20121125/29408_1 /TAXON_ID=697907 /ORGANISM="non described non described, Strain CCMP2293" /LENGTH=478 /DNA_ID=CAMNT_0022293835 /DNA_START=9 /DNA_END=1445 /DNA_ORIENTATION=-